MKRRFYEKSLYISAVFVFMSLVTIILGFVNFSWGEVRIALLCFGFAIGILSLMVLIASLVRYSLIEEDGILLHVYDDERAEPRKQKIYFDQIESITETVYEAKKGRIFLLILSALLLKDADVGIAKHSVFTLKMKNGEKLYTTLYGYSKKNQEVIINALDNGNCFDKR